MGSNPHPMIQENALNEGKAALPVMTVAFINCLKSENSRLRRAHLQHQTKDHQSHPISIVPLDAETSPCGLSAKQMPVCHPGLNLGSDPESTKIEATDSQHLIVRYLIECISNNFNNLLMGLWGNVTLLRMTYDKTDTIGIHLSKMEELIESSAFLIHMVLGYLCERRIAARRLRLDQIVQGLIEAGYHHSILGDRDGLRKRLQWAATIQKPSLIAGSTAKVLDILLRSLRGYRQDFGTIPIDDVGIERKMDHIDTMILKGQRLVDNLLLYAGDMEPVFVNTPLKPVLADVLRDLWQPYSNLKFVLKELPDQYRMRMDRALFSSALRKLMRYIAADQDEIMLSGKCTGGGVLPIDIICRANQSNDHVTVVNIVVPPTAATPLKRNTSLEAFWEFPLSDTSKGLELAGAAAVIKAHGGSIRWCSPKDAGNSFQISLPIL